ncbi:eukaryotic translation initiation factor 4B1 isoform X2 [Lycium ferocissimum]|uniref:eukaryotic translation initiation factor 4B1 isoform X2 n=1 Tax=Lycium ferocissimum TaxID=112874 RepID=UPI00281665B5|nr:eukaryotic translation initiation factor 4B1 isoform X2 [Lycium ferocissimum]
MSKSPWGNIGAWAAEAELAEAEEKEAEAAAAAAAAAAAPPQSYPSLKEAAKQKKKTKMSLQQFTLGSRPGSGSTSRLTPDEMLRLPTGPKERSPEEMQYGGGRLGGGFPNYGGGTRGMGGPPGPGRVGRDREGGGYGGFDDDRRGGPPSRDFDQPSRADEADNWASSKKSFPLGSGPGPARSNRYDSLGSGGISRADGDDNWGASKKQQPNVGPPPPQGGRSWFPDSGPRPDTERWSREGNHERQRLVLDPPKMEVGSENVVVKGNKPNPFGAARPREEVLAEKGLDWKQLDKEIEVKKGMGSRPTSSQSSRPESSHSARSEGLTALDGGVVKPKPKVNPFGDAKPREVLLEEKGLDWRKIDLELEHRRVDRAETEEEKNLKEELEKLRKEATECSEEDKTNLQNVINQKEKDLELLIRGLDDKVRFSQKPIQRPGSGSGRVGGLSDRGFSQPASYEDRRAGDQMDRPRSRGGGDAWARPNDQMERPRSRSGVDAWARPNEQVERPRSRGGGDGWARPGDERRSFQGGRGGYFGSRESDRTRSGNRW